MWYQLPAFILCIFPVGIIVGLLVIKAESIWPAAMLHASHNAFDQTVFGIMTSGENKMYFVSETVIFTIVFVWVIAVILYLKIYQEACSEFENLLMDLILKIGKFDKSITWLEPKNLTFKIAKDTRYSYKVYAAMKPFNDFLNKALDDYDMPVR